MSGRPEPGRAGAEPVGGVRGEAGDASPGGPSLGGLNAPDDPLAAVVERADPALRAAARGAPAPERVASAGTDPDRAFVLEAVREGYLLHYGESRAFAGLDPDLELLGGDTLYALGIARLAATGDLEGVAELADLIALCARARAEGREELVEPLWRASGAVLAGDDRAEGARATFARLTAEQ